ncbi:MAG: diacyltrehalose acyltransferase, partial [Mycobacterium sp.]|nr:diacyltrehalose acyltransferase [Mycobacterium sp.]
MRILFASISALVTVCATVFFGSGISTADETQAGWTPDHGAPDGPPPLGTPGRGYALGGAHVLGIPYDEYIKRTGADWFPGL